MSLLLLSVDKQILVPYGTNVYCSINIYETDTAVYLLFDGVRQKMRRNGNLP